MNPKAALPHPRIFYGWFVVLAAFAVTFVGFGCAYTFSAFVEVAAAGFRRLARLGVAGVLARRVSLFRPRHRQRSARRPCGSRRLAVARHDSDRPWPRGRERGAQSSEVYAAYGLGVGLGVGCAYVPAHRRGAAMVRPTPRVRLRSRGERNRRRHAGRCRHWLSLLIESLGWRGAYLILGVLAAVVGGGLALLIENDPRDRGLGPDGDRPPSGAQPARPEGHSVRDAIRSRRFISSVCCVPDLLIRRVCAVRPSRALRAGSRRCRPHPPYCCSA